MKEYILEVIGKLLLVLLLCVSFPIGTFIIVVGTIVGFILGFEITDDMGCKLVGWPFWLVEKLFKKKVDL